MFENLSDRLMQTVHKLRGQARLTEDNIRDALREVRMALLEADVALPVVRQFIEQVRERAVGREVLRSLNPGQVLIKVVNEELVRVMGAESVEINLRARTPAVILLAGLQGAGKTTTSAKLASWLRQTRSKSVLLVSTDVRRPAAIDQLERLASEIEVPFYRGNPDDGALAIANQALDAARREQAQVLIVDTAGRLSIDEAMMDEIRALHAALDPSETLFVIDAMTGQDAVNTAKAFGEALPLSGVVLSKVDGDARGGAALSVRHVTGVPIKFLGTGERQGALEVFHPDRLASRILGMGDVLSLVEEVEQKVDRQEAEKLAKRMQSGKRFTLDDLKAQMEQMDKMGDLGDLLAKMPGMSGLPGNLKDQVNNREVRRLIAIINSMTPHERRFPDVINGSRKRRIAQGSGTRVQDVNKLLKQYQQMQKMMKKLKGGGMAKMMRSLQGRLPPGMMPPGSGGF